MTIFSKIVLGQIPCHKVAEDASYLAFLDINPLQEGHTLVIPKKEVDQLFDLDDETYLGLMAFAKRVAVAIKKTIPCNRIGVAVIGLEVPHAHVHLIPINGMKDMDFGREKLTFTAEELVDTAGRIARNFHDQGGN